jgi:hypothetical protein
MVFERARYPSKTVPAFPLMERQLSHENLIAVLLPLAQCRTWGMAVPVPFTHRIVCRTLGVEASMPFVQRIMHITFEIVVSLLFVQRIVHRAFGMAVPLPFPTRIMFGMVVSMLLPTRILCIFVNRVVRTFMEALSDSQLLPSRFQFLFWWG